MEKIVKEFSRNFFKKENLMYIQEKTAANMPPASSTNENGVPPASIHWFRHGLRLHDSPALLESLKFGGDFYPIFIFDGEVAGVYEKGSKCFGM